MLEKSSRTHTNDEVLEEEKVEWLEIKTRPALITLHRYLVLKNPQLLPQVVRWILQFAGGGARRNPDASTST
jgi:hypothetical protein